MSDEEKQATIKAEREKFLKDEFFKLAWAGAVQHNGALYRKGTKDACKKIFNKHIREEIKPKLEDWLANRYAKGGVSDQAHFANILELRKCLVACKRANADWDQFLASDEESSLCKIATAQKLLNLLAKYWWCAGYIEETPPHCPIDRIVYGDAAKQGAKGLPKTKDEFSWTKHLEDDPATKDFDASKYGEVIKAFKTFAGLQGKSLAEWELVSWNAE